LPVDYSKGRKGESCGQGKTGRVRFYQAALPAARELSAASTERIFNKMSRMILWAGLVLSVPMLLMGLTHLDTAKPWAILFWLVIGVGAAYKLFKKPARAS